MAGFYDFQYVTQWAWHGEISLLKQPGVILNNEKQAERDDILNSYPVQTENNVYMTRGPFTGFGSDNVADARMN